MGAVVFTQRVEIIESYNERRDCADQRIAEFIHYCGYIPIPLPNKANMAEELLKEINPTGIILTGGNSLVKYGGNAPERDAMDKMLIQLAINRRIPLYGFCRGMQSILDFFDNALVEVKNHVAVRHTIRGSNYKFNVNSYHNQACVGFLNDNLIAVMRSDDGVVEMIKHKDLPIIGTMWHPEREDPFDERDVNRVKTLFQ